MSRQKRIGFFFAISVIFFDMLLYSVIIPLSPYYEESFKISPTLIGVLFSSYSVTLLLFTPYFGNLTDRIGRKKPLIVGLAGMIVATILFSHPINFATLVIARGLQGMASAATFTAALALIADLFTKNERAVMMGFAMTSMSAGMLLGAPVGGFLVEFAGYEAPFYIISILMAVMVIFGIISMQDKKLPGDVQDSKKLSRLLKKPEIIWILVLLVVSEGAMTMLEPILPIYLSAVFTDNPIFIGLMFGVVTLAYGVMAPVSGYLINRYPPSMVVLAGLLLSGLFLPFVVLAQSTWQLIIALALLGGALGIAISPTLTMLGETQDGGEQASYGTLYSLFNLFFAISAILGPLAGGVLTDVLSAKTTILVTSGAVLVSTCGLFLSRKKNVATHEGRPSLSMRQAE